MQKTSHVSELILLALLLLMVGLTRIYYEDGTCHIASASPMAVWKGELSLNDTLVNICDFAKMPTSEMEKSHRDVLYQMQEMGLLPAVTGKSQAKSIKPIPPAADQTKQPADAKPGDPAKPPDAPGEKKGLTK